MKFLKLLPALIVLILSGCANVSEDVIETSLNQADNNLRSIESAKELALNASAILDTESRANTRKVSSDNQVKIGFPKKSRSNQPMYYVVNYDNEAGFAIIPTAANNDNVLAIVEQGSFNPEDPMPDNGFSLYMEAVESYLDITDNDNDKVGPFSTKASVEQILKVEPRVKMMPNQKYPENKYVMEGEADAGCGPVALLMASSFIQQPKSLYISFLPSPVTETFNWEAMSMHNAGLDEYNSANMEHCPASDEAHEMISLYCKEIFKRSDSKVVSDGTITDERYLYRTIAAIIPSKYYQLHANSLSCSDLDAALWDGIVLISGRNRDKTDGHAWIADGIHRYVYYNGTDPFGNPLYGQKSTIYYHFNWGWGGNCNGYFLPDVIDPNYAAIYDNGDKNNTSSHDYSILKSGVAFYPDDDKYIQQ